MTPIVLLLAAALAAPPAPQPAPVDAVTRTVAPAPPDLSGRWKVEMIHATSSRIPIGRAVSYTRSLVLATVREDARGVVQEHRPCHVGIDGKPSLIKTTVPQAFVDALPRTVFRPTWTQEDGDWVWRADLGPQDVGWAHQGGPLPVDADAANLLDEDGDGKPGVTVVVSVPLFGTHEVYVAQRSHATVEARWDGAALEGTLGTVRIDQTVLGSTSRLFANHPPELDPEDGLSFFRMTRVDEATTCRDLVRAARLEEAGYPAASAKASPGPSSTSP